MAKTTKPAKTPSPKKNSGAKKKALRAAGALPLPESMPMPAEVKASKALRAGDSAFHTYSVPQAGSDILDALWSTVESRRTSGDVDHSHSARLMARGTPKVAQKLGEEAVECVIEATLGNRAATVLESADLLYHLIVVWVDAGIRPEEVWTELARRQGISGIAERASRPKPIMRAARTTKLP